MGNVIASAAAWLNATRTAYMSSPVSYLRGSDAEEIQATKGKSVFEVQSGDGSVLQIEAQDFIVNWADMDPLPTAGDRIVFGGETFEVMPFGQESCFRNSDEFNNAIRIHTKKVASET